MYKLLCTDMDGTLLNSYGKVSENNLKAIERAHEKGVKIVICTGRLFTSADYYADLIGVRTPVISANGAYVREKDRNEVIYKSILGVDNCYKILKVLKKYDIYPHFNSSDTVFTEKIIHSSFSYAKSNESLPKDRQIKITLIKDWDEAFNKNKDEILKCICIDNDIKKIQKAKNELLKDNELEVVSSAENNFEVMCKGVSKGRAVEILTGYYGITKDEIICIGDNENDLSMIKFAGLGVAMGNGEEYVKSAADFITDSNDNDGVAKVIEKFILG